jgi:hypothetical protein
MHPKPRSFRNGKFRLGFVSAAALLAAGILASSPTHAASPRVVLSPAAGFSITWDGNNGGFFNPAAGAGPSNNVALASNGTVAFGSSELNFGVHFIPNVNDGLYGNAHSWIADFTVPDANPFIGLRFASSVNVSSIAWSRDNGDTTETGCSGGTCTDRAIGTYTLQYTTVANPDKTTPETGDATTGWANIGTVQYLAGADDASFSAYLRHRFNVAKGGSPIAATGIRFKVPDASSDLDEIEINPIADPVPPIGNFIEITPTTGFTIGWDRNEGVNSTTASPAPVPVNDASTSRGAVAFGSSQLDFGVHFIPNVNDGLYGNAHSWIPDFAAHPDAAPFIGINFGQRIHLRNIAWGRDNGDNVEGKFTDRTLGVYVLQYTTVTNPGVATPEACGITPEVGWVTLGVFNYKGNDATYFNSHLRHRFAVAQGGGPISATAIRIKVPNNQIDIDEIEVNANVALEAKALSISSAPGVSVRWDGNDGHFNNPAVGAAPPDNRALANHGTTPFTSSDLGPSLGIPFHRAVNLNDGLYGNANSWISANGIGGTSDSNPFAGLSFGGTVSITNIAWSRDNGNVPGDCCGGTLTDRAIGRYTLQYTVVSAPDAATAETGDAATGWADLTTIIYSNAVAGVFTPYLRHRFDITSGAVDATGIRIKISDGSMDLDEIEVNTSTIAPPSPAAVGVTPAFGYEITWDGNDGHFFDPATGAAPPSNRALATQGTTPFTSSDLGPALGIPFHRAVNLNDGLYDNSHSWISADGIGGNSDPVPYAALNFNGTVNITNVAWGRDNGDSAFVGTDRALGLYTLQVTTVPSPDGTVAETEDASTGWATLGTVEYRRADPPDFNPELRHRFEVSSGGFPVEATGLRIKVPNGLIAIDEIEVNTAAARPQPHLRISRSGASISISWTGGGGLESATTINGPWECVPGAVSPYVAGADPIRFYRARR